ncbi:hypothetical protein O3M35_005630 [Rhynocoris fuscipes]|uniref:Uncharacterized protein n=1 Tax=Rhynocoris fuscipes TaxID=488301 RepID=A0AAW1DP89_9HEMI
MTTRSLGLSKLLLGICKLHVKERNFFARKISTSFILLNKIKTCPEIKYETDKTESTKNINVSKQLLENSLIWKKPIEEKEILIYRDTFNEYVRKLGISSKNDELLSLENQDSVFLENKAKYDKISRYKHQIFDLALLLKCSPHEAYQALIKHPFLSQSKISTLKTKADLITVIFVS